jgi:hypothetical protein
MAALHIYSKHLVGFNTGADRLGEMMSYPEAWRQPKTES